MTRSMPRQFAAASRPSSSRKTKRLRESRSESWKRVFLESRAREPKSWSDTEERELTLAHAKIGELMMRLELAEHLTEKRASGASGRGLNGEKGSPSAGRRHPLNLIGQVRHVARSSVYATQAPPAPAGPPGKRGQKTRWRR